MKPCSKECGFFCVKKSFHSSFHLLHLSLHCQTTKTTHQCVGDESQHGHRAADERENAKIRVAQSHEDVSCREKRHADA